MAIVCDGVCRIVVLMDDSLSDHPCRQPGLRYLPVIHVKIIIFGFMVMIKDLYGVPID
jgi:hypothetical protein